MKTFTYELRHRENQILGRTPQIFELVHHIQVDLLSREPLRILGIQSQVSTWKVVEDHCAQAVLVATGHPGSFMPKFVGVMAFLRQLLHLLESVFYGLFAVKYRTIACFCFELIS